MNRPQMSVAFAILMDYAKFAFMINLVREIIKDIQDIDGDKEQKMNTLPIAIGISKTNKVSFVLLLIPVLYLFYYLNNYLFANNLFYGILYMFVFVIAPMILGLVRLWNAKETNDYSQISTLLKWIMFFGIISVAVITYNIKHHA
jgi:4-hydroxybenzoate polyprenyltransferase